jgi:membrane-associated phospholipid phosphatase
VSPEALDRRLLVLARTRGHSRSAERVISAYSRTGEHAACWLALGAGGGLLASGQRRRRWWRGVRIVAAGYVLNTAVKFLIRRPRPQLPDLPPLVPTVSSLSFPSAHATTSFAAAAAYGGLVPRAALYTLAAGFALSRPYLGVHYPSDVLAGALLGTALAELWPEAG